MTATEATVGPDRYWPAWNDDVHKRPAEVFRDLASYVATEPLMDVRFSLRRPALEAQPADADEERQMAALAYERLAAEGIDFWREPWMPGSGQRIRDPWLVARQRMGTCLDFATTYASLLLEAVVPPVIAVTSRTVRERSYLHAVVLVQPGRAATEEEERPLPGCEHPDLIDGVTRITAWDALQAALARDEVLAVDFSHDLDAAPPSFDQALEQGRRHLDIVRRDGGDVWLTDVAWLHTHGNVTPKPRLEVRAPIRRHVPGGRGPFVRYRSHAAIVEDLETRDGVVVLLGRPGTGKSTIGRELAYGALFGAGWFLNASEPQTLIRSLSEAEAKEERDSSAPRELVDRQGPAAAALARLRDTSDEWVVVLDNADGDPGRIVPWLPRPNLDRPAGVRQLVVITTTNEDWRHQGLPLVELPPVEDEEAATLDAVGPDLVPLVQGRPLMFDAFARLAAATGMEAARLASYAPREADDPAPAALWAAAQAAEGLDADARACAEHAAWLPPDAQPLATLASLLPEVDVDRAAERLDALGLVAIDGQTRQLRMHRLVGGAIRRDLEHRDPEAADEVLLRIATCEAAVKLLETGDAESMARLDDALERLDAKAAEPARELGSALHAVASLLELHGQTRRSGDRYAAAERHLADDDVVRRALGLHGRARTINQHHAREEDRLREALALSLEARAMLEDAGRHNDADRCLAMEGLLRQKLANFPGEGETTVELLREALAILEEADRRRTARSAERTEALRSRFNLAGIRVRLARSVPEEAADHLEQADTVYREVGLEREELYGVRHHPHVAACVIGRAYVAYFRALLVPAEPPQQARWLREATNHTIEALRTREAQDGQLDLDESAKALSFLTKVALARQAVAGTRRDPDGTRTKLDRALVDGLDEIFAAIAAP